MATTETIECYNCGKPVVKEAKELKRQRKNGRYKFYCGLSCSAAKGNLETPRGTGNPENLIANNRRDEYTPMRFFLRSCQNRKRENGREVDITLDYLLALWNSQQGICPFTGWALLLPHDCEGWNGSSSVRSASLDRINNTFGYVEGNVRFISIVANYTRNTFTDEQVINFCRAVSVYNAKSIRPNQAILDPEEKLFGWYINNANKRKNRGRTDLDTGYLRNLWIEQRGACPFTGYDLHLPLRKTYKYVGSWPYGQNPMNASLDRIDSSLGYVRGNVRFISVMANYGRSTFSDAEFIEFCKAVATNHPTNSMISTTYGVGAEVLPLRSYANS